MEKTLALDLGTNSIGWVIRDTSFSDNQFRKAGVVTFNKGVGENKSGEYSFAAERTSKRSVRRLYQARKYKLWKTLDALRMAGCCPISEDDLNQWRRYSKKEGYFRKYPVNATEFNNWIKLDFNNDGIPEYSSPYELRAELATEKLDLKLDINKYKLGRALYHIAQHRAFKSSKKVNLKEESELHSSIVGAEKDKHRELNKKLEELGLGYDGSKTIGQVFYDAERVYKKIKTGRIRNNLHPFVIRKDLQYEVKAIFDFQNLSFGSIFKDSAGNEIQISRSPIFWQRPLRSQKGTIGRCTLEPSKFRCPVSHPAFEEFRAWSFLNSIQYKIKGDSESKWTQLELSLKQELFNEKFIGRLKSSFDFSEIYLWLKKKNGHDRWELNYNPRTNVPACPVSARLRDVFGDNWNSLKIPHLPNDRRKGSGGKKTFYTTEDVWHIPFSCDDEEFVRNFAVEKLGLNDEQSSGYYKLWESMPVDYSNLSLKAIKNINYFLRKGLIYTEAALLAKVPEVLGERWLENETDLIANIGDIIERNRVTKKRLIVVNNLIAQFKARPFNEKSAESSFEYQLDEEDKKQVLNECIQSYGTFTWAKMQSKEQKEILEYVTNQYQSFFSDQRRLFKKLPHLLDTIKVELNEKFNLSFEQLKKLYHPSQIDIYPPAKRKYYAEYGREYLLLDSPKTGAFKNPMAMRALFELRKLINYLIITEQIDEQTRIVVELARELNDTNKRWAIETYQNMKAKENKEFADAIQELVKEEGNIADPTRNDDIDKFRLWYDLIQGDDGKMGYEKGKVFLENAAVSKTKKGRNGDEEEFEEFTENNFERINKYLYFKLKSAGEDTLKKYRLWKEQKCICMYTGRMIGIHQLFKDGTIDFEHTLPRSKSFDNSLENLTVCYADYNRRVKKNQIPFHLPNYNNDTPEGSAIKPRLEAWEKKVADLERHIEFWKAKSKRATTKGEKDKAIRQKHLWQFELDYWKGKLSRFKMEEVKSGFKNSQLVDTQLISKYALHYLRTVFNHVDVQKGSTTAVFRKILGIQPLDESKDRTKYSHHAKDAIVLSVVPIAAIREQMLKCWYEIEERRKLLSWSASDGDRVQTEVSLLKLELSELMNRCRMPRVNDIINSLDRQILITNVLKDQTLSPAKRKIRRRGEVITVKNRDGITKLDVKGRPTELWAKGDIIRGQLHEESFLGAIKLVKKDENGKWKRDSEGRFEFDDVRFVIREPLVFKKDAQSPGFLSLDDLKKQIVDHHLYDMIETQSKSSGGFKQALTEGVWMLDKNGLKVNKIRHVRVFVRSSNPLSLKEHTYTSLKPTKILDNRAHKMTYWANNKERPYYAMYELMGKLIPETFTLKEVAELKAKSINPVKKFADLLEVTKPSGAKLKFTLQKGKMLIFLKESIETYKTLPEFYLNSMYRIEGFEEDGRITLKHHLTSKDNKEIKAEMRLRQLPENGATSINFDNSIPLLRLRIHIFSKGIRAYNYAVEDLHFSVNPDGGINWMV